MLVRVIVLCTNNNKLLQEEVVCVNYNNCIFTWYKCAYYMTHVVIINILTFIEYILVSIFLHTIILVAFYQAPRCHQGEISISSYKKRTGSSSEQHPPSFISLSEERTHQRRTITKCTIMKCNGCLFNYDIVFHYI